ncbi:MAG TPA: hypothetical protein PK054_12225 [Anaerohalosphaeraceae bacterium]|nr:hypothetical protein [Anaerohalosphaeraceae bacterium]HPP57332.1 hypothetical protein [Anaerohalosphaeraceae bacterium]
MEKAFINIGLINETIAAVCQEIAKTSKKKMDWHSLSEVDYVREATICICSSQMRFEIAEAAGNRVAQMESLKQRNFYSSITTLQEMEKIFDNPFDVNINGKARNIRPRFKNRYFFYLSQTFQAFASNNLSFSTILSSATTSKNARYALTRNVVGFGPKQASLFLRRIGFSNDLAILDTHILDYLQIARNIRPKLSMLSNLCVYEKIENEFANIASEFNHIVGTVDLAVWITMRVAKKEMAL